MTLAVQSMHNSSEFQFQSIFARESVGFGLDQVSFSIQKGCLDVCTAKVIQENTAFPMLMPKQDLTIRSEEIQIPRCPQKCCKQRSQSPRATIVPEKPKLKCMGFTYNGAKLLNMLPPQMRETKDSNTFKTLMIWEKIPSY